MTASSDPEDIADFSRTLEDPKMAKPLRRRKKSAKPRTKPNKHEEDDFQNHVCVWLSKNAAPMPILVWYAVPNGGRRDPKEAVRLKAMGVKTGVYDLHFHWRTDDGPRTGFIELKVGDNNRSDEQKKFGNAMDAMGHLTAVCWCMSEVEGTLRGWGVPMKNSPN